jgi:hypothetical protein
MKDADLRRKYHRLCLKHGYDDSEKGFRLFKLGVDWARAEAADVYMQDAEFVSALMGAAEEQRELEATDAENF